MNVGRFSPLFSSSHWSSPRHLLQQGGFCLISCPAPNLSQEHLAEGGKELGREGESLLCFGPQLFQSGVHLVASQP